MLSAARMAGALVLCTASAHADPLLVGSGGDQGYYYKAFLVSTGQTTLEEIRSAVVRLVSNDGNVSEGEWSVDCSKGLPRITRPDGTYILIDLVDGPTADTALDHEVWWAVCRGEAPHWNSFHTDPAAKAKPGAAGSFKALDSTFSYKVLPAGDRDVVPSLATVRLTGTGLDGQEAVVSCSTEPTVYWKRSDEMVQFGWTELRDRYGKDIGEVSAALLKAVCG